MQILSFKIIYYNKFKIIFAREENDIFHNNNIYVN